MVKELSRAKVRKELSRYKSIKDKLDDNRYDNFHQLSDLWTKLYNKTVDLENASSELDSLDDDLNNQGDINDGEDMLDFLTEQSSEARDFATKQYLSEAAGSIHNMAALYVRDPSDPSEVDLATDHTISLIVGDIIDDLEDYVG